MVFTDHLFAPPIIIILFAPPIVSLVEEYMLDICALLKDNNQIKDGPSPTLETGLRGLKNCRCMSNTLMYVWVPPEYKQHPVYFEVT